MKFTTDSYIEIGTSHNICEDYALNGIINGEVPYIIVSDGCSSSKMTDFGSRIMAHACRRMLVNAYFTGVMKELIGKIRGHNFQTYLSTTIKHCAMETVERFNLSYDVCDATLLYALIFNKRIYVFGHGDGNVIIRFKRDNNIVLENLQFESNAPFYLSYEMDLLRKKGYMEDERFGNKYFQVTRHILTKDFKDVVLMRDDNENAGFKPTTPYHYRADAMPIASVTLTSDGMESYSHSHKRLCTEPAPSEEEIQSLKPISIAKRMTAYKNHNGEFVKRRMKRMKQEVEKIQGEHFDDVSCATIWIDHDKES